jgi:hypothetical protein
MSSDNDDPDERRRKRTKALAGFIAIDFVWLMITLAGYPSFSAVDWAFDAAGAMFPLLTVWVIVGLCCGWCDRPEDEPRALRLRREGWAYFTLGLAVLPSMIIFDAICVIAGVISGVWYGAILVGGCTVLLLVGLWTSWRKIQEAAALRSKAAQPMMLVLLPRHVESHSAVMVVNRFQSRPPPHRRR